MAKTPVKKPVVKTVAKPVVKTVAKPVVKAAVKPAVKAVAKPVVKAAVKPVAKPVIKASVPKQTEVINTMEGSSPEKSGCGCGVSCACSKKPCGCGRFLKKLIVFFVIFALGFVACKSMCGKDHRGHGKMDKMDIYTDGCVDASKVKCPMMLKMLDAADTNADGCITEDEVMAAKKAAMGTEGCKSADCGMMR